MAGHEHFAIRHPQVRVAPNEDIRRMLGDIPRMTPSLPPRTQQAQFGAPMPMANAKVLPKHLVRRFVQQHPSNLNPNHWICAAAASTESDQRVGAFVRTERPTQDQLFRQPNQRVWQQWQQRLATQCQCQQHLSAAALTQHFEGFGIVSVEAFMNSRIIVNFNMPAGDCLGDWPIFRSTIAAAARQKAGWNSNTSNGWSDASRPGTAETQQRYHPEPSLAQQRYHA